MDTPDPSAISLASAICQGANRGWNTDSSIRNRRLLGLLIWFHGYCAGFISILSVIGVVAGRNVGRNLMGAVITAAVAAGLIKLGSLIRRSAVRT